MEISRLKTLSEGRIPWRAPYFTRIFQEPLTPPRRKSIFDVERKRAPRCRRNSGVKGHEVLSLWETDEIVHWQCTKLGRFLCMQSILIWTFNVDDEFDYCLISIKLLRCRVPPKGTKKLLESIFTNPTGVRTHGDGGVYLKVLRIFFYPLGSGKQLVEYRF